MSQQNFFAKFSMSSEGTTPKAEHENKSCGRIEGIDKEGAHIDTEEAADIKPLYYQYHPLSSPTSVRLIELLPGKSTEPISCALRPMNLEDSTPFEALSYVWGSTRDKKTIFCFDHGNTSQLQKSTLQVTVNCWYALCRLRLEDQTRELWIDAICINQQDQDEKSQQVPLMGNLYMKAACVLVYLGYYEDSTKISDVFKVFKSLAVQATRFPEGVMTGLSAFGGIDQLVKFDVSFRKFFERAWFKRCWTLQEIGFAQRALLICDGDELEWDVFFSVIRWFNKYQTLDRINLDLPTQEFAMSVNLYKAFKGEEVSTFHHQPDFLDVLNAARSRQCTDPKDRIYAFLGHPTAVNEEGPLIRPSYIQTTWVVFYEFALSYLKSTQNLRILSAVDHGKKLPPSSFPLSWIPWWNSSSCLCNLGLSYLYKASAGSEEFQSIRLGGTLLADLDIDEILDDSPLFEWQELMQPSSYTDESLEYVSLRAHKDIVTYKLSKMLSTPGASTAPPTVDEVQSWFKPKEAKLSVRGLILDEVRLACPVLDKEDFAMHSFSKERDPESHSVERLCLAVREQKFPSRYEDSLLALSLTLVAGMHNSEPVDDLDEHKASFIAYRQAVQTCRVHILSQEASQEWHKQTVNGAAMDTADLGSPPPGSSWKKFMINAAQACHGRRFFPTASGYFGLGPAAMTGEDIFCCILFGATVPFVLQKYGDVYRFVGEAYVHGVMNGEAIEMWKRGELEEVDFQLF